MNLSIVIVNYKSKEKTYRCIDSIYNSDLESIEYEIIVIDNNSHDEIGQEIEKKYPKVKFVQSYKNLGMGAGNNLGIELSKGDYILILNPDTIVEKDSIKKLYNYIKNNESVGVVGPKLLNPDRTLQYSCFREWKFLTPLYRRTFFGRFRKKHVDNFLMKDFDHDKISEVDWLLGSCIMVEKNILDEIGGGFDHRYFMYFEDTDLARSIRDKGYKAVYLPDSIVIHDHERSSASKPWYIAPFTDRLAREHIKSWFKYFLKWK